MIRSFMLATVAISSLAVATPGLAASPFDGTWRADLKAAKYDPKPDVILLKDGVYSCSTCTPALTIKADGAIHATPGRDYGDAAQITVVDGKTVKSAMFKGGQMYSESTRTVSDDGNTVTSAYRSNYNPQNKWLAGTAMMQRVGPAPAGAHAISGSWTPLVTDKTQVPEEQMVATMSLDGNTYNWSSPTGVRFTGMLGGPAVPMIGDKAGTTVAVKRLAPDTLQVTYYLKGKAISTDTMKATDASTITIASRDLRAGFDDTIVLRKQ